MLGVFFPSQISDKNWFVILLPIPLLLAILPNIIAVESAWHAMQARLSLREQGGFSDGKRHTLRVQPGIDRIIDGIRDNRRYNLISTVLIGVSFSMIILATATKSGSVAWNLALMVSVITGFVYTLHAQYTNLNIRQLGDRFPNLVLHAPTHHQTQLGSILSDLVSSHLDPDLQLDWAEWKKKFHAALMPGYDKRQALERLLYLLYLHDLGELSTEETGKEFSFNLLDRLQIDLLSGRPEISRAKWRMDVALDDICVEGATNLFIVLNNQTFEKRNVRVEVLVPNGEPLSRTHRFELEACPPPRNALKLSAPKDEDSLDWLPRYLHKGVVLWMNVAWNREFFGETNLQVVLRDDEGVVLESKILTTKVSRASSGVLRKRMLRLEKARKIGEMDIPTFT